MDKIDTALIKTSHEIDLMAKQLNNQNQTYILCIINTLLSKQQTTMVKSKGA